MAMNSVRFDFSGTQVLVTGGSNGIGLGIARGFAEAGASVHVTGTRTRASDYPHDLSTFTYTALDVRDAEAIGRVASSLLSLDVLVNNAGANLRKLAIDVTAAEWREVMEVNVTGTFLLTQQVGRHLIDSGRPGAIVNIASTHGLVGASERSTYGIAKGAIIQMTRMLAIEWAAHGIRVNAVAPGRLDTASPSRAADPKYMAAMLERIPLHRLATAAEVADAVAYLAGPQAQSVTGQVLVLDGGLTVA
jgi:NAD(P)-dependent dehydrogenase (short-subunit alcohol dehydrogenase family)